MDDDKITELGGFHNITYSHSDKFNRHYYKINKEFAEKIIKTANENNLTPSCVKIFKQSAGKKTFYYLKAKQELRHGGEEEVFISFGVYTPDEENSDATGGTKTNYLYATLNKIQEEN